MNFSELEFKDHPAKMGGIQAKKIFRNGWGISVIKTPFSYGGPTGLYELAVLGKDGDIHYRNPVADGDVRGYLTEEEVTQLGTEVENYKERERQREGEDRPDNDSAGPSLA
jgi:hypothetical protein